MAKVTNELIKMKQMIKVNGQKLDALNQKYIHIMKSMDIFWQVFGGPAKQKEHNDKVLTEQALQKLEKKVVPEK